MLSKEMKNIEQTLENASISAVSPQFKKTNQIKLFRREKMEGPPQSFKAAL